MPYRSVAATRRGRDHLENEDAFLADDARGLYVISDGVGSTRGAGTASALVVEVIAAHARESVPSSFRQAARRLHAAGKETPAFESMAAGATLLLLAPPERAVPERVVGHVGDARCYLVREGRLEQLTRDHSVAWEQFEQGALTKDQLRGHKNQRLLTRTFSARKDFVVPEISTAALVAGDRFLLLTDGIVKEVPEERIAEIARTLPWEDWPRTLLQEAAGEEDDATVVSVAPES